jgi:hypothetical protein
MTVKNSIKTQCSEVAEIVLKQLPQHDRGTAYRIASALMKIDTVDCANFYAALFSACSIASDITRVLS